MKQLIVFFALLLSMGATAQVTKNSIRFVVTETGTYETGNPKIGFASEDGNTSVVLSFPGKKHTTSTLMYC